MDFSQYNLKEQGRYEREEGPSRRRKRSEGKVVIDFKDVIHLGQLPTLPSFSAGPFFLLPPNPPVTWLTEAMGTVVSRSGRQQRRSGQWLVGETRWPLEFRVLHGSGSSESYRPSRGRLNQQTVGDAPA